MKRKLDIWYARPASIYGYEIDVPDDLLEDDADPNELNEWVLDNLPWAEAEPDEWDWA
jgi:hypothetical protein